MLHINDNKTAITDEDIKFIPQIKDSGIELSGGENTKSYMQDVRRAHSGTRRGISSFIARKTGIKREGSILGDGLYAETKTCI